MWIVGCAVDRKKSRVCVLLNTQDSKIHQWSWVSLTLMTTWTEKKALIKPHCLKRRSSVCKEGSNNVYTLLAQCKAPCCGWVSFGLLCVNYSLRIESQGTGAKMQIFWLLLLNFYHIFSRFHFETMKLAAFFILWYVSPTSINIVFNYSIE